MKKTVKPPNGKKTPNGGDFSEIYYFDEEGNSVSEDIAKMVTIRELLNDGTVVAETYSSIN